ncbi:MAG: hypothetical protein HYY16_13995 [Planctomycetes bacterium]|nr:hypothetical protein [Planctomycetota bacterium]
MCSWPHLLAICSLFFPAPNPAVTQEQDPPETPLTRQLTELQTDVERLSHENASLRKDLEDLRALSEESAKEILFLRQALRNAGAVLPEKTDTDPRAETDATKAPASYEVPHGPAQVLRARVLAVDAEFAFLIIDKGESDGVKPGYLFDIMRRTRVPSDDAGKPEDSRREKLGTAKFETYIESSRGAYSKLKITEGRAQDMKYEDEAIAHRKIEPAAETAGAQVPAAPGVRKFTITGLAGEEYWLNYGSTHGARQNDRVFVFRDQRKRAEMRLDKVDQDWSVGRLIAGTQNGAFGLGDEILTKDLRAPIVGRVKWNDDKRGIVLEAGLKNGVKPGMQFEVRRQGRTIGVVAVKRALDFACEVEPVGDLKREDVYLDDFAESIE